LHTFSWFFFWKKFVYDIFLAIFQNKVRTDVARGIGRLNRTSCSKLTGRSPPYGRPYMRFQEHSNLKLTLLSKVRMKALADFSVCLAHSVCGVDMSRFPRLGRYTFVY
jgi:hypothetical protein